NTEHAQCQGELDHLRREDCAPQPATRGGCCAHVFAYTKLLEARGGAESHEAADRERVRIMSRTCGPEVARHHDKQQETQYVGQDPRGGQPDCVTYCGHFPPV